MSDNPSSLALLLLGPGGGAALYWALYRYYRNTDKSHAFERETTVKAQPVIGSDRKVGVNNGTQEKHIKGNNVQAYRSRVERIECNERAEKKQHMAAEGICSLQGAEPTGAPAAAQQDAVAVKNPRALPCPRCGGQITVETKALGVPVVCAKCGARFKTRKKRDP